MNILGIVVEYNPFHNGHLHHLQASQHKTSADLTIAVMSGSFLQRGEPALIDKWSRTKMALKSGVDLVIELPYIYSTQKAETFSDAAVSMLHALGVNKLCFGSESGNIQVFQDTVEQIATHEDKLNVLIKKNVKTGHSYPKAFSIAFQQLFQSDDTLDLTKPNNILGYHYMKSIQKLSSSIIGETIVREKADFHDSAITHRIASATAIRKELINEKKPIEELIHHMPEASIDELKKHQKSKGSFAHWEIYFPLLQYRILTESSVALSQIYECEEGLEHRLKKMISHHNSFQGFMKDVKTKRYTWTRLQRLFVHILTNTTKSFMNQYCKPLNPPYIRVLGMSSRGRNYLSTIKSSLNIPLVTRSMEITHPVLEKDTIVSQIHSLPFLKEEGLLDEIKGIPIQMNKD